MKFRFNEKLLLDEISQYLESNNFKFQRERKLPENNTKVDIFVYTKPPTLIEFIRLGTLYNHRMELLLSKLILLKTINEGNIRLISVFYTVKTEDDKKLDVLRKTLNSIKESLLFTNFADKIIFIEDLYENQSDPLISENTLTEINLALKSSFKVTDLVINLNKFQEEDYNLQKLQTTLENWINSPNQTMLLQSFYYHHFSDIIKENLKNKFLENWESWITQLEDSRYPPINIPKSAQDHFEKLFLTSGWDFEDPELENVFFMYPLRTIEFHTDEIAKFFLEEAKAVRKKLRSKTPKFKESYDNIRLSIRDLLMNYCLLNSNLREFLPLSRLTLDEIIFSGYYLLKLKKKVVVFKVLNPNEIGGSIPVSNFSKLIKAYFNEKIELFIFLYNFSPVRFYKEKNYYLEDLINLSENGWKIYPFLSFEKNVDFINKFAEEVI